ncbi:hypothetical protein M8J75_013269 [Diaphorina citri]|nr:hypothetical protein M8J75_013269 [Diaphorina citri]
MAESVQACEEVSQELYHAIVKSKLLSVQEIKLLAVKRRAFEQGIKMPSSDAEEQYIRYISYDWDLMEMIQRRRDKAEEMDPERLNRSRNVAMMFGNNINHLFKDLLDRFPNNLKNWALYLDFCRKMKMHKASFDLVEKLIKIHSDKPIAFAFAAEWTLMRKHSYELARTYLLQGLHSHRDSHDLYLELLKNELEFTTMLKQKYASEDTADKDNLKDDLIRGVNCKLVYEDARATLGMNSKTAPLYKSMVEMMKKYPFTREFQTDIISDVLKKIPSCEIFQELAAKSHLINKLDSAPKTTPYPMNEIQKCYEAFRTILKGPCSSELMWSLALDFLEATLDQTGGQEEANQLKMYYLDTANKAHEKDKLGVNQYITWMKMLHKDGRPEQFSAIQSHVLQEPRLNKSPDIWLSKEDNKVYDLFKRGYCVLENKALPLFLHVVAYFVPHNKARTKEIYEIGINLAQYPDLCSALRVKYLEWLVLTAGRNEAREFYIKYRQKPPFSRDLHSTMYKIEWSGGIINEINREHMDQIMELACFQFGKYNVDVWIDRIRHDLEFHSGVHMDNIVSSAKNYMEDSTELKTKVMELKGELMIDLTEKDDDLESCVMSSEHNRPVGDTGESLVQSESYMQSILGGASLCYKKRQGGSSGHSSVRSVDPNDL